MLSTWGAGVSYARCLNVIMRNSDMIDIATMADFFGNVWQVNAILMTTPMSRGKAYFQPVATVMNLFSHHCGKHAVNVTYSGDIDAVATKTDNKIFLHIANTNMTQSQELKLDLGGKEILDVKMFGVAESPMTEVTPCNMDVFAIREFPTEKELLTIPAAAVVAVEITVAS